MADKNNDGQPDDLTLIPKTDEVFSDYQDSIDDQIKVSNNDLEVKTTEFNGAMSNRRYATDKVDQGRKAVQEYMLISNYVSTTVGQDVCEIEGKIATAIATSGKVKTKLDEAVDAIKAAKDKMAIVDSMACKLSDALKESCNADQLRILSKSIAFDSLAQDIITKADEAHDASDDAYEVSIKVSAVHAFANVESLEEHGASLKAKGTAFKEDVDENLIFNNEKLAEGQTELTASLVALSTAECAKYQSYLYCDSLNKLKDDVTKLQDGTDVKDMPTIGTELEKICMDVEDAFDYLEEDRLLDESKEETDDNWSEDS